MHKRRYITRGNCRICKSSQLFKFINLGKQPLANAFLKKNGLKKKEPVFPLDVYFCKHCNLAQLGVVVDKELLYRNYVYFTSGMPKISDHFKNYATNVIKKYLVRKKAFIVEIASNDGILLKFFKDYGYKVLGVEPARNIADVAKKLGVPTLCNFFSEKLALDIVKKNGKAQAILANNVVAHIDNHHDLARGVCGLLDKKGVFILEAPYLVDMFENLTFDTIYHEHLSFLAIRPLKVLFGQYDMEIIDVQIVPAQGMSIRVFVGHKNQHQIAPIVSRLIRKELQLKMNSISSYRQLAKRIEISKKNLTVLLKKLKKQGKKIAAYGAPAKGNTLLNYYRIGPKTLDFALEDLPSKHDLYTPGMHIPVVKRSYAEAHLPDYYLLLAWNYLKPILEKEVNYRNNGGKFIIPIGDNIKII